MRGFDKGLIQQLAVSCLMSVEIKKKEALNRYFKLTGQERIICRKT